MKHCSSEHLFLSRAVVKNEWSHSPTPCISTTLQFPYRTLHYRQFSERSQYYGVLGCDALRFGKFSQNFREICCMHIHGGNLSARGKEKVRIICMGVLKKTQSRQRTDRNSTLLQRLWIVLLSWCTKQHNVEYFKYFGGMITDDAECKRGIKSRIAIAKEQHLTRRRLSSPTN